MQRKKVQKQISELRRVAKQERLDRIKWLKMAINNYNSAPVKKRG